MIVTNNKIVAEQYNEHSLFVDGSTLDVLLKCQELLSESYDLLTHPMTGNVQISKTPYKSVVMQKADKVQEKSYELINAAIEKAREGKEPNHPKSVLDDYAFIDLELIKGPLEDLL
ncbi:GrdX family protein [Coprothermobacter platensis]|uniref:GrdX family protein n=1 Tax=Coprothermobacter platensis TaxID=108819 RepID=UPI000375668A|nr:GrdX family protein [Coprothermobacter platensis]